MGFSYQIVVEKLLRPVIRACLRHTVHYNELMELVKKSFVTVAVEELERHSQVANVSKISVITGLNRREVTRIFREKGEGKRESAGITRRVLAAWENQKEFRTKGGKPRVLTYEDKDSEFHQLVFSISQDMAAKTVLNELERIGAVEFTPQGVRLVKASSALTRESSESFDVYTTELEHVQQSLEQIIYGDRKPKNHHLMTEFDNIPKSKLPQIRRWLVREGAAFHKKVRNFLASHDLDINPDPTKEGGETVRISSKSWTSGWEDI
ncbi:MAG: hypothetical protein KDD64_16440 [Bdellovibrionales bacterium]|nr:hypothetical protein [Bdellovibrionales bacterium]